MSGLQTAALLLCLYFLHIYTQFWCIMILFTVPPFSARISRIVEDVEAPGGQSGNV